MIVFLVMTCSFLEISVIAGAVCLFVFLMNQLVFFFETRIKILGFVFRVNLSQDSGLWIIFQ